MFMRKKNKGSATEEVIQQSRNFEVSLIEITKKSERRAWIIAFSATALSTLLAAGYIFVMPLKEQIPYLVLADPYRGTSSVARIDQLDPTYTSHEFLNKSNAAHFVIARESYDWDVSSRRDRRLVYSMATGSVLNEYKRLYHANNPENPDKTLGPNISLRIKILNIILSGQENGKSPNTANVRFERWQFNRRTGESRYLDTKIATLKIGYDKNLQMNEEGRLENPLGFRVYGYRIDPDSFGAATNVPPVQVQATESASLSPTDSTVPIVPPPALPASSHTSTTEPAIIPSSTDEGVAQ